MMHSLSSAPPLTDELLQRYGEMFAAMEPSSLRRCLLWMLDACNTWWSHEESADPGTPHPSGKGVVKRLPAEVRADLSMPQLQEAAALCDAIPTSPKALRDAAHHLLWHCHEFALGREPITSDTL